MIQRSMMLDNDYGPSVWGSINLPGLLKFNDYCWIKQLSCQMKLYFLFPQYFIMSACRRICVLHCGFPISDFITNDHRVKDRFAVTHNSNCQIVTKYSLRLLYFADNQSA